METTPAPENGMPTHDEIASLAEKLYLASGSLPGRDLENWLHAETELRLLATTPAQSQTPSLPAPPILVAEAPRGPGSGKGDSIAPS